MKENKKEFDGSLGSISPNLLVIDSSADLDDFFLVLSIIFNDLKGLLFFGINLEEDYRHPEPDEFTPHSGEYGGLRLQQYKLLAGLINEFLEFLETNKKMLISPRFQLIKASIPQPVRAQWLELEALALGGDLQTKSTFAYSLMIIRHNVAFHYHQAAQNMHTSFRNFFNRQPKDEGNTRASYSIGKSMMDTRFYFADAAVQEYISMQAAQVKKEGHPLSFMEHYSALQKTVGEMNHAIEAVIKKHIEIKKQKGS